MRETGYLISGFILLKNMINPIFMSDFEMLYFIDI